MTDFFVMSFTTFRKADIEQLVIVLGRPGAVIVRVGGREDDREELFRLVNANFATTSHLDIYGVGLI